MRSPSLRPSGIGWRRLATNAPAEACRTSTLQSYDQNMDATRARQRLQDAQARQRRLAERLRQAEADPVESGELSTVDQHPAELGSETFERELELTTLTIVEGELKDIDDALGRLDRGTYGICEECGKLIDEARLEAVPWARYCVVDQARIEQALSRR